MAGLQKAMLALLHYAPDSIFFKRYVDGKFLIEIVSESKARKYGDSYLDLMGKSDYDLLLKKEEAQECHNDELRVMQTLEPLINQEKELTRPDGTKTWVSETKFPWIDDDSGEVIGIIGISRDITDKKRMERHILHMVARISHDVQKELFLIGGTIGSLLKGRRGVVDEEAKKHLEDIYALAINAKNTVQEYLKESSQMIADGVLKKELLDLRKDIINPLLEEFDQELKKKDIRIDNILGAIPEGEIMIMVTKDIKTVLRNLFSNAIFHTYPSGVIAYGFRRLEAERCCLINVYNTGEVIPQEKWEEIFEMGKSSSGSSGMGLYLCREIVRGWGGEIWYQISPDGNSDFVFSLPD